MNFIKVIAMPCNREGSTRGQIQRVFFLNIDLIGAIFENNIWLKSDEKLCLNGKYFTDIKLAEEINPKDL